MFELIRKILNDPVVDQGLPDNNNQGRPGDYNGDELVS